MEDEVQHALRCEGGARDWLLWNGTAGRGPGLELGVHIRNSFDALKKYRCSPVGPSKSESLDRRSQACSPCGPTQKPSDL